MNLNIYSTYEEANRELGLPRDEGRFGDLTPIPALSTDEHLEQYSCVVYIRKWTYDGNTAPPDLTFIGFICIRHFCDGYKTDVFIYDKV